jgi:hypothetical protein
MYRFAQKKHIYLGLRNIVHMYTCTNLGVGLFSGIHLSANSALSSAQYGDLRSFYTQDDWL